MADPGKPADGRKLLRSLLSFAGSDEAWMEQARAERNSSGSPLFSEIIHEVTHVRLAENEAEALWPRLLRHRSGLRADLGRDPGLAVALLDWFANVDPRLRDPVVVERARLERTEKSAMTDWLTGLFNRGAFRSAAHRELRRAQRYRQRLSVVLLDLDDFKAVNDRHGHERGDQVLRDLGRLLRRSVRDVDMACRYGGEEFALLLPETGRAGARAVAERVRAAMARHEERVEAAEAPLSVSVSAGIAVYPDDGEDLTQVLRQADLALYRAKAEGKNRVVSEWDERRRAERYALIEPLSRVLLRADGRGRALRGTARDISRTGLAVLLPEVLEVGEHVRVDLSGEAWRAERRLSGRVVRYREAREPEARLAFEVGIAFDEPSCREAEAAIAVCRPAGPTRIAVERSSES